MVGLWVQARELVAPVSLDSVWSAQRTHALAPVANWYVLGPQLVHCAAPEAE
jgi:hypothetical protein